MAFIEGLGGSAPAPPIAAGAALAKVYNPPPSARIVAAAVHATSPAPAPVAGPPAPAPTPGPAPPSVGGSSGGGGDLGFGAAQSEHLAVVAAQGTTLPPAVYPAPEGTEPGPGDGDDGGWLEGGEEPSDEDYADWEVEYVAFANEGDRVLAAAGHPRPGTEIGEPYQGTHSVAFNRAGGSDNWESENAIDVWLYPGTGIVACVDGVVSPGGWGYGPSGAGGRFAGDRLHLIGADGFAAFYTHMRTLVARKGQRVRKGQLVGWSGIANGVPHLHFAVRPPRTPHGFVRAAYDLKLHQPGTGKPPPTGSTPPPVTVPRPVGVQDAWAHVIDLYGKGVPAHRERVRSLVSDPRSFITGG